MINYDFNSTQNFLTEQNLGEFLIEFLIGKEIIHDKKVPNSNIRNRPDYRIESLKLIIEFNGKFHYTNPNTIVNDYKKTRVYIDMRYKVVSIPYWIQLTKEVIFYIFNDVIELQFEKLKDYNDYPLGFISEDCPLPATFCELGLMEMLKEKKKFSLVFDNYHKYFDFTLIDKILKQDSFLKVANLTTLPYFKMFWKNKGVGFEYSINTNEFPNINEELKYI